MAHTPGPWRVAGAGFISSEHGYVPICTPFIEGANTDKHGGATPEALANARLIAAAPELLEALDRILKALDADRTISPSMPVQISWETNGVAIDRARQAIAKATGE